MFQPLESERLTLDQFDIVSASQWQLLMNNKLVALTTLSLNYPCTISDAEIWKAQQMEKVNAGKLLRWAVFKKENEEVIGSIKLALNTKFESAELGYWLGKAHWGKGYAFEATTQTVNFAFNQLKLNRLEAYAMTHNLSSEKILFKLGFRQEGLHRKLIKRWGEFIDVKSYALLQEDLRHKKSLFT